MLLHNTFSGRDLDGTMRIRRVWARHLLSGLGIKIRVKGIVPDFPCLLVANHRAYVDPILVLRDKDALPVAKKEMADWPLLGYGARISGIIYIQREESGSRLKTLRQMSEHLKNGRSIILFPEGTTSALNGTLPFLPGGFQLAAKLQIPVVPVALLFEDERDYWVTKESFMKHASRRFGEKEIHIGVHYGPVLQSDNAETLRDGAKSWIDSEIKGNASLKF